MSSLFSRCRRLSALLADASAARTERCNANGHVVLPLCRLTRRRTGAGVQQQFTSSRRDIRQTLRGLPRSDGSVVWTLAPDRCRVDVNLLLPGLREPLM